MADTFGAPIVSSTVDHGAAHGAALLAAVGAGVFETVEAAAREGIRWSGRLEPDAGAAPALESAYRRYQALYPALRSSFEVAGQG